MKTGKVTNVQGSGTFKELYVFELELDNNDAGKIYKKGQDAGVKVGDEITYTINDKGCSAYIKSGNSVNSADVLRLADTFTNWVNGAETEVVAKTEKVVAKIDNTDLPF